MNLFKSATPLFSHSLTFAVLLAASSSSFAAELNAPIDDFSQTKNSLGLERQYVSDAVAGGGTTTEQTLKEGILSVKGNILPPRGQPGWASTVLPLGPEGQAQDASPFKGIRLLIKVNAGNISITANSTQVSNFDYHTKPIAVATDGKFHEVKVPFSAMKRTWSEQTALNTQTLHSLSIVAFSPQKGTFDYAIDAISFY